MEQKQGAITAKIRRTEKDVCIILFWNVYGLNLKDEEMLKYIKSFDIIGLTETWIEDKKSIEGKTLLWSQFCVKQRDGRNSSRRGRNWNQKQSAKNEEEKEESRLGNRLACLVTNKDASIVIEKLGYGTVYLLIFFDIFVTFFGMYLNFNYNLQNVPSTAKIR